ncbi:MAG: N-acetylglucosamine-6-phosphate deacetylase [Clostridia bacterium]|nr:N-acetylglucosamine-6-phosphate deacetylase [Clostridia bacterium]
MLLKNGNILYDDFTFRSGDLSISGGKITFDDTSSKDVIDCTDCYVVPGLIDIHTHGAEGFDALDGSFEAIDEISKFMASNGVTTYLPNIMTQSHENMLAAAKSVREAYKKGVGGANIGGIYMEGPYFSEKHKGAQNFNYLRLPSTKEFDELNAASGNLVRIISLAPELDGAFDFIKAKKDTVRIAMGHTDADYDTAMTAISLGASVLTHSFNAMRGLHHRNPNAIGAALDGGIFCECICDGFHLSGTVVRMLYKTVGADKMVLISDNIRATGLPDGVCDSGGLEVFIKNGEARLADGTIAGSTTPLLSCMKKAVTFGVKLEDAFKMASLNPAKAAGIDDITGSLTEGKRADVLILNKDLSIKNVIIGGRIYK